MRKIISLILIFYSLNCIAQTRTIYIGYPWHIDSLKNHDLIIIDRLPWHPNGYIDKNSEIYFDTMKDFMRKNYNFQYYVYLYTGLKDSVISLSYTNFQSKVLLDYFFYSDSLFYSEYIIGIIPKGNSHPLFGHFDKSINLSKIDRLYLNESVVIELVLKREDD